MLISTLSSRRSKAVNKWRAILFRRYTEPIRPFIYWHSEKRDKSHQASSTWVLNGGSQQHMDLLLSLINAKLFNSCDEQQSPHTFVFLNFFFPPTAFSCGRSHLFPLSHLLPFSCLFCFPNTCVCRQPSLCQGTHGEVIGTGSLWASNHEINMDGHEWDERGSSVLPSACVRLWM